MTQINATFWEYLDEAKQEAEHQARLNCQPYKVSEVTITTAQERATAWLVEPLVCEAVYHPESVDDTGYVAKAVYFPGGLG